VNEPAQDVVPGGSQALFDEGVAVLARDLSAEVLEADRKPPMDQVAAAGSSGYEEFRSGLQGAARRLLAVRYDGADPGFLFPARLELADGRG
jgi:hypothetical protein